MFNIIDLTKGEVLSSSNGEPYTWKTGKEVQKVCDNYNFAFGEGKKVLQPRKIVINKNWKEREAQKFKDGVYTLPEFLAPYDLPNHFLHVSKDRKHLAYTKDAIKGAQDAQAKISFEGYFEKYFPSIKEPIYSELKDKWELYLLGVDGFKIAMDAGEIEKIYKNYDPDSDSLTGSCMRGEFGHLPQHPTTVYAAGDLGIAYIQDELNRTIARALVWPEKKIYSRVYGKSILHSLLKLRGYKKGPYYSDGDPTKSMVGAKLLNIKAGKFYLMPYFDEPNLFAVEDGDFLVLRRELEDHECNTRFATGVSGNPNSEYTCAICGGDIEAGDVSLVYTRTGNARYWCPDCATDDNIFYCARLGRNYETGLHEYDMEDSDGYDQSEYQIRMHNGELWSRHAFNNYGFNCQKTGARLPRNQRVSVYTITGDQESWSLSALEIHGWTCVFSGQSYSNAVPSIKVTKESTTFEKVHISSINLSQYRTEDGKVYTLIPLCERTLHDIIPVPPPTTTESFRPVPRYPETYLVQPPSTTSVFDPLEVINRVTGVEDLSRDVTVPEARRNED